MKPYFESQSGTTALVRVYPLPNGYKLCRFDRMTANRATLEDHDRATVWNPNGGIEWSGRNAADGARLVRLIRSGQY